MCSRDVNRGGMRVALSRDGKALATSNSVSVRLWDVHSRPCETKKAVAAFYCFGTGRIPAWGRLSIKKRLVRTRPQPVKLFTKAATQRRFVFRAAHTKRIGECSTILNSWLRLTHAKRLPAGVVLAGMTRRDCWTRRRIG
jgi:hypothetical protein